MLTKKQCFALLALSSLAMNAVAQRVSTQWFVPVQVGSDYNGPVYVITPAGIADECNNKLQSYTGAPDGASNENGYKNFMSISLAAQIAKREVKIDYNNTAGCYSYKIEIK